jgi:CO/xanthine dehydrogenase FAD-binding subunit
MDLNTITEVLRPASTEAVTKWENDFAWLAGGTWLFSEPQIHIHTLIDLETLKWPSLQASQDGLEIAGMKPR